MHRVIVLILGLVLCMVPRIGFAQDAAQGILKVTSSVEGAVIHVDHELIGDAPQTRYLSPGKHTVRVSADGFDPFVRRVTVEPDHTTGIHADLKPGGGTVEIFFKPMGAKVEISGQEVGPSPIRLDTVQPGEHSWRVSAPKHLAAEGTFSFVEGGNVWVAGQLESSVGVVWVDSDPAGARVRIDDEDRGVTPLQLTGIAPGPHAMSIEAEGAAVAIRSFDNSDGELVEMDVRLGDTGANVTVQSSSAAAVVQVDGQTLGTGKKVKVFLERGRYVLRVDAPGLQSLVEAVDVPPMGAVVYKADLAEEGAQEPSTLVIARPLMARWTTWAIAGGAAAGAGAVAGVVAVAMAPEPDPNGDVVVPLP